ncbi:hypothetical protein FRAAL0489 [Frankia alni ACN14a]|uniref:Uncharacterized protein n=1 Tax=Frankia alni (strain DSM 45986 / CECT 9034 / ACN14a) TaxID=326424 RepID=Q0RTD7_FRAAA|nr:hypothetical protein FRAAL0489 [Frankia alni ACN14a]
MSPNGPRGCPEPSGDKGTVPQEAAVPPMRERPRFPSAVLNAPFARPP